MSISNILDALTAKSKNSISMQLKQTSASTLEDVKSRKRAYLREPMPHELMLQALCAGTSTIEELRQSSDETNDSKSAKSREIDKLLQLKARLDLPSVSLEKKEKAGKIARSLEEHRSSTELHRKGYKKMVAVAQLEQQRLNSMNTNDSDNDDGGDDNEYSISEQSILDFNEVKNEKASIIDILPLELSERQEMINITMSKIKEQQEIEQTLRQMVLISTEHRKTFLLEQLSECSQEWKMLVLKEHSPSKAKATTKRTNKPMAKPTTKPMPKDNLPILQKTARLLHSDHQGTALPDLRNLIQLSKSFQDERQPFMLSIDLYASTTGIYSRVYYKILNFVQHNGENTAQATSHLDRFRAIFPNAVPTFTGFFQTNQESNVIASILLELDNNDKSMAMADLTRFVQDLAKEQGYSEQEAIQCIYTLVGVGLVIIDRSQTESIVRISS
ncbi:hypothetical protein HMPREF1544_05022 [Mucor circinelloides 1006PhL]|uniref:Uncharacterized protein n=1 Tax=Mucor circinelloides f. circinelloides (strain 1006PhL) TaxID=1220926 RepID=S2JEB8_MUCC1|nr:hypothetical protein HMPREF1544_05022 [Mucor circinelloides 1006PhL]